MSEEVLIALGDLTNGALNYYKATKTVMVRKRVIEEYIEQLQQENQQLKEQLQQRDEVIEEAIKYTQNNNLWTSKETNNGYSYMKNECRELLDILNKYNGGNNENNRI